MVFLCELSEESSSVHDFQYDVFLSFRGVDSRNNFTDHLYTSLKDANLETFLDDEEIETGLLLKPALDSAIKTSRASIIVLSKNYASSTWCLEELVLILEQHKKFNQIVIPIFYHVEPTDVRKQRNTFGDAMAKHKERMEEEANVEKRSKLAQKIELWSLALTQVANMKGKDATGRKETELIEEIVSDVHRLLHAPLSNTRPLLIGMDNDIKFITSWLTDGSCHTNILTVSGIGGIGKTNLVKYVFGLHYRRFHKSSFIEGINRRCKEHFRGLLDLQKQLYEDICKKSTLQIHDVSVYTSKIENALTRKKVLLVLDDIDSLQQLEALLGSKGFHPESKIIITTKDKSLIERCVFFNPQVQQVHLHGLNETEALELLSIHAFKCQKPKEGYEEVSQKFVSCCDGHPLALELVGKCLCNRDVAYWESKIQGLRKVRESFAQQNALQLSIHSLPSENDNDFFKHIACFFDEVDREVTETILEAYNITRSEIKNLVDIFLLSEKEQEQEQEQEEDDDDHKEYAEEGEEDVLSWNHIIGNDLSDLETTSEEYIQRFTQFLQDEPEIDYDENDACVTS